jgi:hypothetical protein
MNVPDREAHMPNRKKTSEDLFEILGRRNEVMGRKGCGKLTRILKN